MILTTFFLCLSCAWSSPSVPIIFHEIDNEGQVVKSDYFDSFGKDDSYFGGNLFFASSSLASKHSEGVKLERSDGVDPSIILLPDDLNGIAEVFAELKTKARPVLSQTKTECPKIPKFSFLENFLSKIDATPFYYFNVLSEHYELMVVFEVQLNGKKIELDVMIPVLNVFGLDEKCTEVTLIKLVHEALSFDTYNMSKDYVSLYEQKDFAEVTEFFYGQFLVYDMLQSLAIRSPFPLVTVSKMFPFLFPVYTEKEWTVFDIHIPAQIVRDGKALLTSFEPKSCCVNFLLKCIREDVEIHELSGNILMAQGSDAMAIPVQGKVAYIHNYAGNASRNLLRMFFDSKQGLNVSYLWASAKGFSTIYGMMDYFEAFGWYAVDFKLPSEVPEVISAKVVDDIGKKYQFVLFARKINYITPEE